VALPPLWKGVRERLRKEEVKGKEERIAHLKSKENCNSFSLEGKEQGEAGALKTGACKNKGERTMWEENTPVRGLPKSKRSVSLSHINLKKKSRGEKQRALTQEKK